jgi:hypothetical protein
VLTGLGIDKEATAAQVTAALDAVQASVISK